MSFVDKEGDSGEEAVVSIVSTIESKVIISLQKISSGNYSIKNQS